MWAGGPICGNLRYLTGLVGYHYGRVRGEEALVNLWGDCAMRLKGAFIDCEAGIYLLAVGSVHRAGLGCHLGGAEEELLGVVVRGVAGCGKDVAELAGVSKILGVVAAALCFSARADTSTNCRRRRREWC